ncbi:MAG: cobalamin-binding protein [Burkholderiaceae bacterium]
MNAVRFMLLAVAGLLIGSAACAQAVQAVDDEGRTVALPQPARRIVSLAPHLTELLFAAGAGDRVVGAVAYSDHPSAARQVPRVGDSAQLDLERIVALKPDLVLVWRDGNSAQQLERVAALKLPVYASKIHRMADIETTLQRLGALAGKQAVADARARDFATEMAALRARYASRAPLAVFYQIWHRPLLTVNGEHLISEALAICGARNIFATQKALTPTVSVEAVLQADPDAIVTGSVDPAGPDNLDGWRALPALRATRNHHLIVVNPDTLHRPSPRVAEGTRDLCERLDRVRAAPLQPR